MYYKNLRVLYKKYSMFICIVKGSVSCLMGSVWQQVKQASHLPPRERNMNENSILIRNCHREKYVALQKAANY